MWIQNLPHWFPRAHQISTESPPKAFSLRPEAAGASGILYAAQLVRTSAVPQAFCAFCSTLFSTTASNL
jgi:hypothetical protein